MALSLPASLSASTIGLRLVKRSDLKFNPQVAPKEGGSGVVSQATLDGELVAVKTPKRAGLSLSKRDNDNFIKESQIAASVRHQNCVALFAACQDRTDPMLVMEWVGGGNLYDILADDNAPPPHVRLKNAREIVGAVDYLHRCRIIHGDLKSLNVLLTSDFSAKVCDFGSATQKLLTTTSVTSSQLDRIPKTVPWCAPELLKGERATFQSDMYAVGIILWELATCKAPFEHTKPDVLAHAITEGLKLGIPSPLPPGFPTGYFEMMQRCWAEPHMRPSAHHLFEYLIQIDPSSRPSAPLLLFPANHAVSHLSLLDCIRPAMPPSPAVDNMLIVMISQAENKFRTSLEVQSICAQCGLSPIEAHSLMVYTMDARESPFFLSREDSIFCAYNAALRGRVSEQVQRWADFSFLFKSALDKLPSIECEVYRGIDLPLTQVSHEYKVGTIVWQPSVTSTTTKKDTALKQFGKSGNSCPGTLFKIRVKFAKSIEVFSMFPDESELLLSPNSCLKIDLALSSEQVANLQDIGTLPENVDLIVATQQPVSIDAVIAAIVKDEEDLQLFTQSQYLVVPPQATIIPSMFAPLSSGSSSATVVFSCDLEVLSKELTWIAANFVLRSDHALCRFDGTQLMSTVFVEAQTSVEKVGVAELKVFLLSKHQKSKDYHFRAASSALRDAVFEKIESQITVLKAICITWPSILQQLQSVLTDEAISSIAYYRNVNFAAAVCVELSESSDRSGLFAEAPDYAAAGKTLHDIFTSRPAPEQELRSKLELFLYQGQMVLPQIDLAYKAAKSREHHTKTLDLQELRNSMGAAVEKADRLQKEEAPWPVVNALQKFGCHLQRWTTLWFLKKRWCPRFFVLENRRLYYSDGKNGHPDTREGTVSFVSSNPQPGSRYCVDLAGATDCMPSECMHAVMSFVGCTVESSHETVDGQEFVFEIKFPPGSQVQVVQLMRNFGIWHLHLSLSQTFVSQSKMLRLAASDDVTRKRCVRVIQAASSSCSSSSPHSIATEVAMTRELFGMKSITAIKSVLAALGVTLDKVSLTSIKFDFSLLKEFEYDSSELLSSGFDLSCLKAANFTAQELQGLGRQAFSFKEAGFSAKELNEIYDLPSLIDAGYSVSELKTAGFTKLQLRNAGLSEQQLQDEFSVPELKTQFFEMPMRSPYDLLNEISIAAAPNHAQSDSAASPYPADNQNTARSCCCKLQQLSAYYYKVLEVVKKYPKIAVTMVVLIIVSVILGATLRSPESNMPSFLGSCSDKVTKCDVGAICTALVAGTSYSCSCPSWMSGSGDVGSPCRCSLSDYSVPDFERGVCVTPNSHMSQGQTAGVAVGVILSLMFWMGLSVVFSWWGFGGGFVFLALLFGLVFGIGHPQFFPVPKATCGLSSSTYKLCDANARCVGGTCVCGPGFLGDGTTCVPGFLGSCRDKVTKCDVGAICTALVAGTSYSCSCPSWMSGSGDVGSPCRCSLSDYSVPDFERGFCVTRASSMSQGQVSGLVLGCSAYAATTLLILGRVYHHIKLRLIVGGVVLLSVLVIGLSTGLTRNQWAPTPKVFCGKSSADFALCDYNAACVSNSCVCNRDYVGDGITCREPSDSDSSSSSTGSVFLFLLFLILIVCAIVVYKRRRDMNNQENNQ